MSRKRPKYVETMLREANLTLRHMKIHDENDSLFMFVCNYLMSLDMYNGFNYYKMDTDLNGKSYPVLAGSSTNYDFLQIY